MKISERLIASVSGVLGVLFVPWGSACFAQDCAPFQTDVLVAPSPASTEWLGVATGLGSGQILVGASLANTWVGSDAGVVYTYLYNGLSVVPAGTIVPSDPGAGDEFGRSISVDGGVALIGARLDDTDGGFNAGSAYVYRFDGAGWAEEAHLLASDAYNGNSFGSSVGIDGDVAVVGAPGADAAYIYRFNGVDWLEEARFTPSHPRVATVAFGSVVSVSGDVVVVGAYKEDESGGESGGAYVYRFDGVAWAEEQRLVPLDARAQQRFGWSVAVRGSRIVVGAPLDFRDWGLTPGAAYVFEYNGSGWGQTAKLIASDEANDDHFGTVAIGDDLVVVGAVFDDTDGGTDAGSAYIFRRTGPGWVESGRLYGDTLPTTGAGDTFGVSFAIDGQAIVVGSAGDDVNSVLDAGSARVFMLGCPLLCLADINGDGFLDNGDINAFIAAFLVGDPAADFNGDGFLDNGDINAFIALFIAGC